MYTYELSLMYHVLYCTMCRQILLEPLHSFPHQYIIALKILLIFLTSSSRAARCSALALWMLARACWSPGTVSGDGVLLGTMGVGACDGSAGAAGT